ncbi:MAG: hypothetical protein E7277_05760 [Lachnospiraceae bacterium]|nr:hypothetical protein [Lachnospiraceae bacterium]
MSLMKQQKIYSQLSESRFRFFWLIIVFAFALFDMFIWNHPDGWSLAAMYFAVLICMEPYWYFRRSDMILSANLHGVWSRKVQFLKHGLIEFIYLSLFSLFMMWQYNGISIRDRIEYMEWVGLIIVLMLYYSILGGAKLFKVFNSLGNAVFILAVIWGRYYKIPAVSAFMRQRTLREAIVILFVVWSFSFALEIFVGEVILEKPFMRKHMDKRLSI